ncbi:matrixin family metalloprotease [Fibrella arboris]|uniref:matrixin family metalloprotease n=1 Tax=Fibrella arboris TaxID=3242486 RepID=UPI0035218832
MKKLLYYGLFIGFIAAGCIGQELSPAQPFYLISDYQQPTASHRFDQCLFRYAVSDQLNESDLSRLQKTLEIPFDRWAEGHGFLTFERVLPTTPADINIVFSDSLSSAKTTYTSFGLIGQPLPPLSQLIKSTKDSSCTIRLRRALLQDPAALQRVLLFQIGAALGLATSTVPTSVMAGERLTTQTVLDASDISAIRRLYKDPCDSWQQLRKPVFGSSTTELAFAVQDRGYILLDAVFDGSALWEYLPKTDSARTRKPFPGQRGSTLGANRVFATSTAAYVGNPYNTFEPGGPATFWRYKPDVDQWDTIAPLPRKGTGLAHTAGLNNRGYVILTNRFSQDTLDVWQYDPATNGWTSPVNWKRPLSSGSAESQVSFTLNQQFYLISTSFSRECLRFDPTQTPAWIPTDSPAPRESQIARLAFSVRNYGFCITDWVDGRPKRLWRYAPPNGWTELKNCPIAGRMIYQFTANNRVYIGTDTGQLWQYTP